LARRHVHPDRAGGGLRRGRVRAGRAAHHQPDGQGDQRNDATHCSTLPQTGPALGAVHYRLVSRADPWWINRSDAEAERVSAQRSHALGSAPALWGLTVLIAIIVPLLVVG